MTEKKHIVVSVDTHKAIRRAAFMADMTMRDFVAKLIKDYNGNNNKT